MFVPSGYQLIHEALSEVGRDQFKSEWTDEENKARSGLISEEEWLRIKELPGARLWLLPITAPSNGKTRWLAPLWL